MIFDACRKQRLQKCTVRKTVLTRNYDAQKTSPLMNKRFGFQKKKTNTEPVSTMVRGLIPSAKLFNRKSFSRKTTHFQSYSCKQLLWVKFWKA